MSAVGFRFIEREMRRARLIKAIETIEAAVNLIEKASACGAGAPGDPGFAENNTCNRFSGGSRKPAAGGGGAAGSSAPEPPEPTPEEDSAKVKSSIQARDEHGATQRALKKPRSIAEARKKNSSELNQLINETEIGESAFARFANDPKEFRRKSKDRVEKISKLIQDYDRFYDDLEKAGYSPKDESKYESVSYWSVRGLLEGVEKRRYETEEEPGLSKYTDWEKTRTEYGSSVFISQSHMKERFPGLSIDLYKRARDLMDRKNKITDEDYKRVNDSDYYKPFEIDSQSGMGAAAANLPTKVQQGGADEVTRKFFTESDVIVQVKPDRINKILEQGKMKNAFQGAAGVGKGKSGYKAVRLETEEKTFGISQKDKTGENRPIYGIIEHPSAQGRANTMVGSNYGTVQIVLKPEVKKSTSFTVGDSLDDSWWNKNVAGSVSNPPALPAGIVPGATSKDWKKEHLDHGTLNPQYIEAQIFGGIDLSKIKEVRIPHGGELSPKALKNLEKAGVRLVTVQPPLRLHKTHYAENEDGLINVWKEGNEGD